jgi:PPOX class probable F420-dependent enzyme
MRVEVCAASKNDEEQLLLQQRWSMITFNQLTQQQYVSLETFRKNGTGVKTPVWFVQDGDTLFVRTIANSGKVKRIRSNGHVNIAHCKSDGTLIGE